MGEFKRKAYIFTTAMVHIIISAVLVDHATANCKLTVLLEYFVWFFYKETWEIAQLLWNLIVIKPALDYVSVVWSPHCQSDIDKLEMVQRRSARFVLNRKNRYASVTNMMSYLGWPTLKVEGQMLN